MKYYSLFMTTLLGSVAFSAPSVANSNFTVSEPAKYTPALALMFDYVNTDGKMYGITLAPRHYDPDYADWGYYIGYAKGNKSDIEVPEPGEGYLKEYMWRFGLSYSLTQDLSLYGGTTMYVYETNTTDNIVPFIVGGEPTWQRSKDKHWGAEAGIRYRIGQGMMLSAGYDTQTEAAIISFGFSM